MKKIWFENIFGAEGAENIYKPDLFHDFQLGYHTTDRTILKCILPEALCTAMPVTSKTNSRTVKRKMLISKKPHHLASIYRKLAL